MPYDNETRHPRTLQGSRLHRARRDQGAAVESEGVKTNSADPNNDKPTPQGNPDDSAYNPGRKLGG